MADIDDKIPGKAALYLSGSLRLLKLTLTAFLPLIFCLLFVGQIWGVSVPALLIIARWYSKTNMSEKAGRYSLWKRRLSFVLYWAPILICLAAYLRTLFPYYPISILLLFVILIYAVVRKKLRKETAAGLMSAACFVFFGLAFYGPSDTSPSPLKQEKYVRPVYLFDNHSTVNGKKNKSYLNGVRMILASPDGSALYFTTDLERPESEEIAENNRSLYRVNLKNTSDVRSFSSGDRIFGLAFTPGGDQLLATSNSDGKLYILDPATLKQLGYRKTNRYPQFIITDPKSETVNVTYEANDPWTVYALPGLKIQREASLKISPSKLYVDNEKRIIYSSNWLYPYLLTAYSLPDLRVVKKKFFLSGISGGISYDRLKDRLYISSLFSGRVYGVDRGTFEVVDIIKAPPLARAVCVDNSTHLILIGNVAEPYVRVYNDKNVLITKIYTGKRCREIYQDPRSGRIFAGTQIGVMEILTKKIASDFKIGS